MAEELQQMVESRCFAAEFPEHTALPAFFLLLQRGKTEEAAQLLRHISPLADTLRLYPKPTQAPLPLGGECQVLTADMAAARIRCHGASYTNPHCKRARRLHGLMAAGVWAELNLQGLTLLARLPADRLAAELQQRGPPAVRDAGARDGGVAEQAVPATPVSASEPGFLATASEPDVSAQACALSEAAAFYEAAHAQLASTLGVHVNALGLNGGRRRRGPTGSLRLLLAALAAVGGRGPPLSPRELGRMCQLVACFQADDGDRARRQAKQGLRQLLVAYSQSHAPLVAVELLEGCSGASTSGVTGLAALTAAMTKGLAELLQEKVASHCKPLLPGSQQLADLTSPSSSPPDITPSMVPLFVTKGLRQARRASPSDLALSGVVSSPTIFASLVRGAAAANVAQAALAAGDPVLASVLQETYHAFGRRRSLLLLNLEHQVRIEELPWYSPLVQLADEQLQEALRISQAREGSGRLDDTRAQGVGESSGDGSGGGNAAAPAAAALPSGSAARPTGVAELVSTALQVWPHCHLPNELVSALRGFGTKAWPLVEQLAGDIFMGTFTDKFAQAAREASAFLRGTLYARHFRLEESALASMPDGATLAALCTARAGKGWSHHVSHNMRIVEEMLIVTGANLPVLISRLGLTPDYDALATRCWRRLAADARCKPQSGGGIWRQRRRLAHAWRNLVFYLSFAARPVLETVAAEAEKSPEPICQKLAHHLRGFLKGGMPGAGSERAAQEAPYFVGWATGGVVGGVIVV
jgi:hypothetical protein